MLFFADIRKLSIGLESPHFPTLSAHVANVDFEQRDRIRN